MSSVVAYWLVQMFQTQWALVLMSHIKIRYIFLIIDCPKYI